MHEKVLAEKIAVANKKAKDKKKAVAATAKKKVEDENKKAELKCTQQVKEEHQGSNKPVRTDFNSDPINKCEEEKFNSLKSVTGKDNFNLNLHLTNAQVLNISPIRDVSVSDWLSNSSQEVDNPETPFKNEQHAHCNLQHILSIKIFFFCLSQANSWSFLSFN